MFENNRQHYRRVFRSMYFGWRNQYLAVMDIQFALLAERRFTGDPIYKKERDMATNNHVLMDWCRLKLSGITVFGPF